MPGGAQALNNPATKNAFATAVRSALHGLREEAIQEAIDGGFNHIASEMAKGKTFNEAATSYAEQFPQNVLTSALLGGGVQAMADKKNGSAPTPQQPATAPQQGAPQQPALADQPAPSQQATPAQQPASPPQPTPPKPPASAQQTSPVQQPTPANPQQQIPHTTTPDNPAPPSGQPSPSAAPSASAQQPQTTATDGPPSPPPPSGQPAQTSATPSGQQSPTTADNGHPPQTPPSPSGSGQQPQTTANDRQPPQTPSALPPPTTAPKSPEQSQRLINHIMDRPPEQRGHPQVQSDVAQARDVLHDHVQKLETQKEPLSDAQKKDLTDAKTTLSRLPAEKPASTPESTRRPESANRPLAEAPEGALRTHGEVDADAPPAAADPNRTPHSDPAAEAPRSRGHFDQQRIHPADAQTDGAHPTRRLPGDAAPPRGYDSAPTPPSSRNSPDGRSLEPSYPSPARNNSPARNPVDTTPYHPATSTDPQPATNSQLAGRTANGNTPDQPQNAAANPSARPTDNSRPPTPNAPGIPPAPTANVSPPTSPSRTSLPPPRTPPLSPEQSQRLIDNVSKMSPEARQHPQVQADEAQARDVVNAQSPNKTVAGGTQEAPPNVRKPETHGAIPPPENLPPMPDSVDPKLVDDWNRTLDATRVRDPADYAEVLEHLENLGPINKLHVYRAVQSFLDLVPGDITRSLTRFHMRGESAANIKAAVGHTARGAWSPRSVDKLHRGHGVFQEVTTPATIQVSHDLHGNETQLRTTVWHEMTHWLWDEAGRADAPPRLAQWRRDLEQHFYERTAADTPMKDKEGGYWFLPDNWIHNYSGKISNEEPTAQLLANPPVIELATTYMEKLARGGLGPAEWSIFEGADSTFKLVMSILGDTK